MAEQPGRRRGPDPLALVGGLVALGVAASGITGTDPVWALDLRWVLAVVAVLSGVVFLAASLRGPRRSGED